MLKEKRNDLIFLFLILLVCVLKLFHIGYKRVHFSTDLLINSFKENSGREIVVEKKILEANKLILDNKIQNFNISNNLKLNHYFKQRIVEVSYPIKLNQDSKFVITTNKEKLNCQLKSNSKEFKLYEC
tara:strand:+ start:6685 stop:7068 length:384 start_codon:yes stop_codon:yes gene_type:complete